MRKAFHLFICLLVFTGLSNEVDAQQIWSWHDKSLGKEWGEPVSMLNKENDLLLSRQNQEEMIARIRRFPQVRRIQIYDCKNIDYRVLFNVLSELDSLEILELRYNQIGDVPGEIGKMKNLKYLRLEYNALTSLPPEIGNLVHLQVLYLHTVSYVPDSVKDRISSLPDEITQLKDLRVLSLRGEPIERLPDKLGNCQQLQYLNLSLNKVKHLPSSFGTLKNLEKLDITGNRIQHYEGHFTGLINLQDFRMESCSPSVEQFRNLLRQLSDLPNLNSFKIASLGLPEIPAEIGQLHQLERLVVYNSFMDELPPEIGNMKNLKYLDAGNMGLKSLPPEIGRLKSLEVLNLPNNQIVSLPEEFRQLTNLHTLVICDNGMKDVTLLPFIEDLPDIYVQNNPGCR